MYISQASLEEVKYYLILAKDLKYISMTIYEESRKLANECGKLISGFIKYLNSKS